MSVLVPFAHGPIVIKRPTAPLRCADLTSYHEIATYRPLLRRLVQAMGSLVLCVGASWQRISLHSSSISLEAQLREANVWCTASEMSPGVFLAVWHAFQNPG